MEWWPGFASIFSSLGCVGRMLRNRYWAWVAGCLAIYVVIRCTVYTATRYWRILDGMSHPAPISKFSFLYGARSLGRIVIARGDACATRHKGRILFHRETAVLVSRAGCSRHERSLSTIATPTYQWVGYARISNALISGSSNITAPQ